MSDILLPRRPYLLKAIYNWIIDSDFTPYLLVNTSYPGVQVPREYVKDDRIVFNIKPESLGSFLMNNNAIIFETRFAGVSTHVEIPMGAVLAIYAKENGHGMGFEPEPYYTALCKDCTEDHEKAKKEATEKAAAAASPFKIVK